MLFCLPGLFRRGEVDPIVDAPESEDSNEENENEEGNNGGAEPPPRSDAIPVLRRHSSNGSSDLPICAGLGFLVPEGDNHRRKRNTHSNGNHGRKPAVTSRKEAVRSKNGLFSHLAFGTSPTDVMATGKFQIDDIEAWLPPEILAMQNWEQEDEEDEGYLADGKVSFSSTQSLFALDSVNENKEQQEQDKGLTPHTASVSSSFRQLQSYWKETAAKVDHHHPEPIVECCAAAAAKVQKDKEVELVEPPAAAVVPEAHNEVSASFPVCPPMLANHFLPQEEPEEEEIVFDYPDEDNNDDDDNDDVEQQQHVSHDGSELSGPVIFTSPATTCSTLSLDDEVFQAHAARSAARSAAAAALANETTKTTPAATKTRTVVPAAPAAPAVTTRKFQATKIPVPSTSRVRRAALEIEKRQLQNQQRQEHKKRPAPKFRARPVPKTTYQPTTASASFGYGAATATTTNNKQRSSLPWKAKQGEKKQQHSGSKPLSKVQPAPPPSKANSGAPAGWCNESNDTDESPESSNSAPAARTEKRHPEMDLVKWNSFKVQSPSKSSPSSSSPRQTLKSPGRTKKTLQSSQIPHYQMPLQRQPRHQHNAKAATFFKARPAPKTTYECKKPPVLQSQYGKSLENRSVASYAVPAFKARPVPKSTYAQPGKNISHAPPSHTGEEEEVNAVPTATTSLTKPSSAQRVRTPLSSLLDDALFASTKVPPTVVVTTAPVSPPASPTATRPVVGGATTSAADVQNDAAAAAASSPQRPRSPLSSLLDDALFDSTEEPAAAAVVSAPTTSPPASPKATRPSMGGATTANAAAEVPGAAAALTQPSSSLQRPSSPLSSLLDDALFDSTGEPADVVPAPATSPKATTHAAVVSAAAPASPATNPKPRSQNDPSTSTMNNDNNPPTSEAVASDSESMHTTNSTHSTHSTKSSTTSASTPTASPSPLDVLESSSTAPSAMSPDGGRNKNNENGHIHSHNNTTGNISTTHSSDNHDGNDENDNGNSMIVSIPSPPVYDDSSPPPNFTSLEAHETDTVLLPLMGQSLWEIGDH